MENTLIDELTSDEDFHEACAKARQRVLDCVRKSKAFFMSDMPISTDSEIRLFRGEADHEPPAVGATRAEFRVFNLGEMLSSKLLLTEAEVESLDEDVYVVVEALPGCTLKPIRSNYQVDVFDARKLEVASLHGLEMVFSDKRWRDVAWKLLDKARHMLPGTIPVSTLTAIKKAKLEALAEMELAVATIEAEAGRAEKLLEKEAAYGAAQEAAMEAEREMERDLEKKAAWRKEEEAEQRSNSSMSERDFVETIVPSHSREARMANARVKVSLAPVSHSERGYLPVEVVVEKASSEELMPPADYLVWRSGLYYVPVDTFDRMYSEVKPVGENALEMFEREAKMLRASRCWTFTAQLEEWNPDERQFEVSKQIVDPFYHMEDGSKTKWLCGIEHLMEAIEHEQLDRDSSLVVCSDGCVELTERLQLLESWA